MSESPCEASGEMKAGSLGCFIHSDYPVSFADINV
jgi:hypothetical protein